MVESPFRSAFLARKDLDQYGPNALLLYALEMRLHLEDIHTVAADSLTDGSDDKKCDLIYVDTDAQLAVVAQSYISLDETKKEAKSSKASDLNTAVSWLLTRNIDELPDRIRPAAKELRDAIHAKEITRLLIWFVHNLPGSTNVQSELISVQNSASAAIAHYFPDSSLTEISATEVSVEVLDEWYRSLTIPILVTDKISTNVPGGFEIGGDNWTSFVTAVPAKWLYELYLKYKSDLFSANIRSYLGSRDVDANINQRIKYTAEQQPGLFWVYNNGLTILVNDFKYSKRRKLTIDGISIVNGAQTTGAVGSLQESPDELASVPCRFVKCSKLETIKGIIKYNNSQNRVDAPDFRSNDAVQTRLVQEFKRMGSVEYLGGRRGGHEDKIRRVANLLPADTAGQALAAFHGNPGVAYHQKSEIWISDRLYSQYFNEKTTATHILFAYSLLRTVETKKKELMAASTSDSLTESQKDQLKFLRHRGAIFLLTTAVANCLEVVLGKKVANPLQLSFGTVRPEAATDYWKPILDAIMPFAGYLMPAVEVERGLRESSRIKESLKLFRSFVDSTRPINLATYDLFAARVLRG